ncbi:hypothetical protein BKA56DRAFT_680494 [Ilyonectria sp. MPI-CAGE-AT-0026]|nr:hypothetical protein BKA56DRAFT_680494 [Ilyonectria sp. MPI-CAGE-AT-0026]
MKTNQVFGPESIKIFLDGIEIKKTDKSWYTLKSFGEILDMGESQNKPGERIFDFLYECACKHYPLKSSDENYDQRKRASNRFDLAWDVGTQIGDPMGLFIFNLLYANGNRLTSFSRANASFRKAVADEVASKLKLALPDNQTSTFDDMYVIWPPELFRRMMEFKNTKEVKLELPYGAGIQIDSPFVKFGNIKSLLQSDDELLDQFINPDCLAVTSPFLDRSYKASISFTTSQQVQDGSHEAWRCQKSDGVMETGICLGEQTLFLRTEWGKLHDPILVQLMEDLVSFPIALY